MKLSKSYSLKKSKSDEIISFTFPIIDNILKKTNSIGDRQTGDRKTGRRHDAYLPVACLPVDCTPVACLPVGEYDNFELFLRPSIIALYKKIIALLLKR
jgi:hypothetical protein